MGTEILKSFGTLQSELEQAKNSLKGVDENIKRLIGRDPSEIFLRPGQKRGPPTDDNSMGSKRTVIVSGRLQRNTENDQPTTKRRNGISVFKRLSERPNPYEDEQVHPQKQMISKVIVTPREVPSRQEALAAQSTDEKSKARNRRMFGALLGTLQKFQQEEIKLKKKEELRAQVERRIEEHEIKEKAEIRKERQELFMNRKRKQAEIKMIQLKMMRMKEYAVWEDQQKPTMNFIRTKAKPHIYYLPRKMNDKTKALLDVCRTESEKLLDKKRQEVFDELQHIEERMKKNFEGKRNLPDEQGKEIDDKDNELNPSQDDAKLEEDLENEVASINQDVDQSPIPDNAEVSIEQEASEETEGNDIECTENVTVEECTEKNSKSEGGNRETVEMEKSDLSEKE